MENLSYWRSVCYYYNMLKKYYNKKTKKLRNLDLDYYVIIDGFVCTFAHLGYNLKIKIRIAKLSDLILITA